LVIPRCAECSTWRWPATPFCSKCRSQALEWMPAGNARLYSYTIVRQPGPDNTFRIVVPGLVEFPEAGGMRFVAAIVESEIDQIKIGAPLKVGWTPQGKTQRPGLLDRIEQESADGRQGDRRRHIGVSVIGHAARGKILPRPSAPR
jgi:uncharacterized OB-fold protein